MGLFSSFRIETGTRCVVRLDELTALVLPGRRTKLYSFFVMHSASCKQLYSRRTKQTLLISLPKVVSGGSYVYSIKTASDYDNASNKNNENENDIVNIDNNQSGLKRI